LVEAFGEGTTDADSGDDLGETEEAGDGGEFGAELVDDLGGGGALALGFEIDEEASGVPRGGTGTDADAGHEAIDVRFAEDDLGDGLLEFGHFGKGYALSGLGGDENLASVFVGDETFGKEGEEVSGGGDGGESGEENEASVAESEVEGGEIEVEEGVEAFLGEGVKATRFFILMGGEEERAEHGGEGEGDEAADEDGDADDDSELIEEASEDSTHEEHGDEDGDEGDRHGDDGESDFAGADEGGVEWGEAEFDMADDIFEDDDGVIDDEAGGEGHGEEGEVIDAEAEELHDDESADEGEGHGEGGDEGGWEVTEEEKDDEDDEDDGEDESGLDIVNAGANGQGFIGEDIEMDGGRELGTEIGEEGFDGVDDGDGIGAWLFLDGENDASGIAEPAGDFIIFDVVDDAGDLVEADGGAMAIGDDELAVVVGVEELACGLDGDGLMGAGECSGGEIDISVLDGLGDFVDSEVVGG